MNTQKSTMGVSPKKSPNVKPNEMQSQHVIPCPFLPKCRRGWSFIYISFTLAMCCMVLFLTSCVGQATANSSPINPPINPPTPTRQPSPSKADSSGISTEDVLRSQLEVVQRIMNGMTLDQKLGQLIAVEYLGNNYQNSGLQYMVKQQLVGSLLYQASNHNFDPPYNVISNVANLSHQIMSDARIPLLIATDQEGGLVNRLYTFHGDLPSATEMAATGNPQTALAQGTQAAKWLAELGINADLAPVVDVQTVNPPILETRMFGHDPQTVATYAGAYLVGLQSNGVAACLKHFPGLGAITSDPHDGLPAVNRSMAELENIDLAPYRLMISKDHPAMIMATDVLMPAIDPTLPAELSPKAIDGVLRGQLGFNGVVITDGLYMLGISQTWTLSQAAVLSILAGDDIIEGPYTPSQVAEVIVGFKQAISDGRLTIERLNESVRRILLLKVQYGIIK